MIELFRNDFFVARCDSPRAIVEVVRSSMAFRSAHDAALAFTPLLICLDTLGRSRFSLLLDARDSVANNNPDYESWYARYRAELMRDFRRVAILVRTPVGSLQATRLMPPVACPARVFLDPDQAWAFVTEPLSIRPSRRPISPSPYSSPRAGPPPSAASSSLSPDDNEQWVKEARSK